MAILPFLLLGTAVGLSAAIVVRTLYQRIKDRIDDARALTEATLALYHVLKPVSTLPIMRDFAVAPDSALLLHTLVRSKAPRVVVETGSGVSTLIIGYTLKALGQGRLTTLEVDETYAQRMREEVALHGLTEWVTVVHAPLREVQIDGAAHRWHDPAALEGVAAIDLVFDDGPPIHLGRHLRYAALPVLQPKLAADAVYCLNFVEEEEQRNVRRWLQRDPSWRADFRPTRKGNVILTRAAA